MRAGGIWSLLLLLSIIQISLSEDLYLEGEEDASNEFLEVKDTDTGIGSHLRRLKRQWFNFFDPFASSTTTTESPDLEETATEDTEDNDLKDDLEDHFGSGFPDKVEPDHKEKTLRVTFVVMEPYQHEYSNRDSPQFRNFSRTIADAVDQLYEPLSTRRTSLVRIQSRVSDEFSCKVTLDILTTGYEDINRLSDILRDHIKNRRELASGTRRVTVSDDDYSANIIDPDTPLGPCGDDEVACDLDRCFPASSRCNGVRECQDGTDELNCPAKTVQEITSAPTTETYYNPQCSNPIPCQDSVTSYCPEQRCDNYADCPNQDDEQNCESIQPEERPEPEEPEAPATQPPLPCDFPIECQGTDTKYCPIQRCDGIFDCPYQDDEENCNNDVDQNQELEPRFPLAPRTGPSNIQCANPIPCQDSTVTYCPEQRCNSHYDCPNQDDEFGCNVEDYNSYPTPVPTTPATLPPPLPCDFPEQCQGSDIKYCPNQRCDGVPDCPDQDDETNCPDESTTRCPAGEFQCDKTRCLMDTQRCDGTNDCYDQTDEAGCKPIGSDDFRCNDGRSIEASRRCDGVQDCLNAEDERDCDCLSNEFQCYQDRSCIEARRKCDGYADCSDGSDEQECGNTCPEGHISCAVDNTNVPICAKQCDGKTDCLNGEDESNCSDSVCHYCDYKCIESWRICDGIPDCRDESDEEDCALCNGPDDFRCDNGECINRNLQCNNIPECSDSSDERNCKNITNPVSSDCYGQFECRDGACINKDFFCDGHQDCQDNSDEENCPCKEREFQCRSGQCIPETYLCDGYAQCDDSSDESNCPSEYQTPSPPFSFTTHRPENFLPDFGVTRPPFVDPATRYREPSACGSSQWQCESGLCINDHQRCDGHLDCPGLDSSDEFNCPPGSPAALNLKTYPDQQTVTYFGDVVFDCRDEGPNRAKVTWIREGGNRMKPDYNIDGGRLTLNNVTTADSGTYICQAVDYQGQPGAQKTAYLNVEKLVVNTRNRIPSCGPHEATCSNLKCIPKSAICDGRQDCGDGSDEHSCGSSLSGLPGCQPNQFRCANNRCILKTWVCDSENDCDDFSDEDPLQCGAQNTTHGCSSVEYACQSGGQCIPKSYHCDGLADCRDGSDENCAPITIQVPPQPPTVRIYVGDVLRLRCKAVGIPVPLISWRLNWGHVPPQCTSTSEAGEGVLVCPDMKREHSGAYSCEALNNKGASFAVPDSVVIVENPDTEVCPSGQFNSEAHDSSECISCFCFGKSTQCKSADLFVYDLAQPLGQGGTRLVGVKFNQGPQIDTQSITNEYYYQPRRNGASVTKLSYGSRGRSSSYPYLTLPASYTGNQLTSYGGDIKYTLSSQSTYPSARYDNNAPDIIIMGKYETLTYIQSGDKSTIQVKLVPGSWQKYSSGRPIPASREDIMMALDNVENILLRAELNGAGVDITDFIMQSAHHIDAGLGPANLVEECSCPDGYTGLSCQNCASGYERDSSGPWLGDCRPQRKQCPPGTYGDPSLGYACSPCPCPHTSAPNQFASTCYLGPQGVVCDCQPGYEGNNCERCAEGYEGNPLIPGDFCRPVRRSPCDPVGTRQVLPLERCDCKDNVQGQYCDQCKPGFYYLSQDSTHGCAACFCSGVTQNCGSSNLRRKTTYAVFNTDSSVQQLGIYSSTSSRSGYNAPTPTNIQPISDRGVARADIDSNSNDAYYWSLPASFAGDKVTSYGGNLYYTLENVPYSYGPGNSAVDVQLISDNSLTFHHVADAKASISGVLNVTVPIFEKNWIRVDGKEVPREQFLLALADVKTILVKARYDRGNQLASLSRASIETAEPGGSGPPALHVEQCVCPKEYIGSSCEDCAPGYKRYPHGLYLENCGPCECNGHSRMCDPDTGVCLNCADNTAGDFCDECLPGYEKDPYGNCVPTQGPSTCSCDPRGISVPCEDIGYCQCKPNVEGYSCERCRPGTFGLDRENPAGCLACYCSGVTTDCHETQNYKRIPLAAPIFGDKYGGYSITNLNGNNVVASNFVPMPDYSELMYTFQFPPNEELFWSLPVFPGNRVLSYGGVLQFEQKFEDHSLGAIADTHKHVILIGDDTSIAWNTPQPIRTGEKLQVPLQEGEWYLLNTAVPASRNDVMNVLKSLRRVLVKATLTMNLLSTSIADVSMDTATIISGSNYPSVKGIEVCMCPPGYTGTSCETCASGYYKDERGLCRECSCNGHECELTMYGQVVCICRPPYTGATCSTFESSNQEKNTTIPPPPTPTIVVTISQPIVIKEIGGSVTFTCQARSRMVNGYLPVRWSKAGGYLPRNRAIVDDNSGTLVIMQLQKTDTGKYICETTDGQTSNQAVATLTVGDNLRRVPEVSIEPAVNEYNEGDRIELVCRASGNPEPTISWRRADSRKPLPSSATVYGGTLIIQEAAEDDSGDYRCIASNSEGSSDRIALISIRPRPNTPQRDRLTVSNTSPIINEGNSTSVTCTGTPGIPAGTLQWVRQDGTDFQYNVRSENGVLYVENALPENQGVYICQTLYNRVNPVAVSLTVIPLVNPPEDEPNITLSVSSLRIPTGGSGSVDCIPSGYPLPTIKWTRNGAQFGPGTSQRGNTLVITNAQNDDQDYYQCEGLINGEPRANIYVYVEIERREVPQVRIYPEDPQPVTIGDTYELHCRVLSGVPVPDVTWESSRPMTTNAQILPDNILKFENIDVNDEGAYTCTASNVAGKANATAIVKVQSYPVISMTPSPQILAQLGDAINFQCRASGVPLPMVSIKYENGIEIVPPSPGSAILRIKSASARDAGAYRCVASSPAGTLDETFIIDLNRGDLGFEPPRTDSPEPYYPDNNGVDQQPPSNKIVLIEGKENVLRCDAEGYEARWSRADRQPLQSSARPYGDQLLFTDTSKADSGEYECILSDPRTRVPVNAITYRVEVLAPPRITIQPPTQTVHPGQSTNVDCIVDGDQIENVTWLLSKQSSRIEVQNSRLIFHQIEVDDAGDYVCTARNPVAEANGTAKVIVTGPPMTSALVTIDQPRRQYRVGENVEVTCRKVSRDISATWEKYGTREFVETREYNEGVVLVIGGVEESDAGVYRCTGRDRYGLSSYEDFDLNVIPSQQAPSYPTGNQDVHVARVGDTVDMPCRHDLEPPVHIEWRKEYSSELPNYVRRNEPILTLINISEDDAGTYVCRISNQRAAIEARSTLKVTGVIPRFDGNSWLAIPTIKDAYRQFDVEIAFKPLAADGTILFNNQNSDNLGDYLALQLVNGIPVFTLLTGDSSAPLMVEGDRPLQLNAWHTIRLSRAGIKVTMYVDEIGPFVSELHSPWEVLDLSDPMYLGSVPDNVVLPSALNVTDGFVGCISMLVLSKTDVNLIHDRVDSRNVGECDTCVPNLCLNDGVCQEARNERGYLCLCAPGFAGLNCNRTGSACRPGICGPGKCTDTTDGYSCACPVSYTGKNCDIKQYIEYPAFTGSAYLAIKVPTTSRVLKVAMNIKASPPVSDGIILYWAESAKGTGGFTSLTVRNGKLEFTYDLGDGLPVVVTSNRSLQANEWTDVRIARVGSVISLTINQVHTYEGKLGSKTDLTLDTPMFVGGVDDTIVLNENVAINDGFNGCIKDLSVFNDPVNIINSSIQSANIKECSTYDRGDIPEIESVCSQCRNGGACEPDSTVCSCPPGFYGIYCENRASENIPRIPRSPCGDSPCRNGGTCKGDLNSRMKYACDCPLGYSGANCQMPLQLLQSVAFNGNGYIELPASLISYDNLEVDPAVIALAMHTNDDGVLLYQRQVGPAGYGDYILIRVDKGVVVLEWDMGGGASSLSINEVYVTDGERHSIVVKILPEGEINLSVDTINRNAATQSFQKTLNADSNIYIGGIPDSFNVNRYPGLSGCIEQVEFMNSARGLRLGEVAVAARNTQICKDSSSLDEKSNQIFS